METVIIVSVVAAICAGILADRKGRNVAGWVILCVLIPLCLLILVCLGSLKETSREAPIVADPNIPDAGKSGADETTCPFCAETIKKAAKVCKHCGRDLPEPETEPIL